MIPDLNWWSTVGESFQTTRTTVQVKIQCAQMILIILVAIIERVSIANVDRNPNPQLQDTKHFHLPQLMVQVMRRSRGGGRSEKPLVVEIVSV